MMDDDEDLKKDSKFKIVLVGDGSSGKVPLFFSLAEKTRLLEFSLKPIYAITYESKE